MIAEELILVEQSIAVISRVNAYEYFTAGVTSFVQHYMQYFEFVRTVLVSRVIVRVFPDSEVVKIVL